MLGLLFMYAASAHAQHTASDTVVTGEILVTANRFRTSLMLSPNKVQLLGRDFIASINSQKLSDVLGYADGIFIKGYGNSGLKTISMSGTQSEHTLVMLDGVKLNNRQNSQVDLGIIQTDEFERIEISKGGSSALYGSEAIGGIVNIVSKKPEELRKPGIELHASAGSYGLRKYYVKFSQSLGKLNYNLSGTHELANNNFEYILHRGTEEILKQRDGANYTNYSVRLKGELKEFHFFVNYNYWNRSLPSVELGYVSSSAKQIDRDAISSLQYKHGKFTANIQYKYSLMNYTDNAVNSFHKLNTIFQSSDYRSSHFGTGYEISYSNILSSDVEYAHSIQGSIYSDAKIDLAGITFYPSARYDRYSEVNKNIFTGKLGINYKPFRKINLAVKTSFGNNFRLPTFNELLWKGLGNKNLIPEKSVSFDAGICYDFILLTKITVEVSYFNIGTADRIIWQPDNSGVWHPSNVGRVKSEGVDFSLHSKFELPRKFNCALSVNYNYGTSLKKNEDFPGDKTYLKQLLYLPREYFKSSLMLNYLPKIKWLKAIYLTVFYTFTGKRYMNFENTIFAPYFELVDANFCFNLNLFKSTVSLKAAVNNLTNTDYQVITGYPMPLRNYKVEISFKY
jgi:vitamin B12 transporter